DRLNAHLLGLIGLTKDLIGRAAEIGAVHRSATRLSCGVQHSHSTGSHALSEGRERLISQVVVVLDEVDATERKRSAERRELRSGESDRLQRRAGEWSTVYAETVANAGDTEARSRILLCQRRREFKRIQAHALVKGGIAEEYIQKLWHTEPSVHERKLQRGKDNVLRVGCQLKGSSEYVVPDEGVPPGDVERRFYRLLEQQGFGEDRCLPGTGFDAERNLSVFH